MTPTPWRSLLVPAVVLLAATTTAAQTAPQTAPPAAGPPPIQAKPGTPEGTPRTDQTVDVAKGTRLLLTNNAGEVIVRTWNRDAVRVQANHSAREEIDIQSADATLRVRSKARTATPEQRRFMPGRVGGLVDYRLTVPAWMPVNLTGTYLDADIAGTSAEVTVETVGGNVLVSGGSGAVTLRSVEGTITVDKTSGRVQANAVNEAIHLTNTQGEVVAESVNGAVTVENAQTSSLDISTVNGDVTFNGTVRDGGVYRLTTHGGDIRVGLGGAANAIVFVRSFQGDFSADFPIQLPEGQSGTHGSKRFNFTLGAGSARIELQSFNGDIHLARGTVTAGEDDRGRRRFRLRVPEPPAPPAPPKAPAAPKPPKPPVPPIDVDALRDMARAQLDNLRLDVDLDALHEQLGSLDQQMKSLLDEQDWQEIEEGIRQGVEEGLRGLERKKQ